MKTTQQERELIRYDAERGLACMPGQPSVGWLLKLLDDADRCAELEAEKNGLLKRLGERCSCDYLKSAQRLGCAVGPLKCDEFEAEVRRLRDGISDAMLVWADSGINSLAILRALLDGGGE